MNEQRQMKLDSYYRYKVKAEAFRIMTGHRADIYDKWLKENQDCINAMLLAFERVVIDE